MHVMAVHMLRQGTLSVAALAVLLAVSTSAQKISTTLSAPISVPFDQSLRPFNEITALDARDPNALGVGPSQVHLAPAGTDAVFVMWATDQYKVGTGNLTHAPLTPSIVNYGFEADELSFTANGTAEVYDQIYPAVVPIVNITNALNYTSPVLHTVVLHDLEPNTTYYYSVGDGMNMSEVFEYRSLLAPGPTYPQRILTIADLGMTENSSSTVMHALYSAETSPNPPVLFYIGDFCYADTWYGNGTHSGIQGVKSAQGFEGAASGTYQPVWDAFQDMLQPLVSMVPMASNTGNHEIVRPLGKIGTIGKEEQVSTPNSTVFASVQARWKTNGNPAFPQSYFFHSSDIGPTHSIFLSVYVDYTPGSPQWTWLAQDLASVDRTVTPWVTISIHNPWYTTDGSYKQYEQMRVAMEPLTYQFGADVFFYGHVHSYERTAPVHNYVADPCGAVHITIGDGGNGEGISGKTGPANAQPIDKYTLPKYEDANGCPNVTLGTRASFMVEPPGNTTDHFSYYRTVLTFQADGNSTGVGNPGGYCYAEQPIWSQYRESSFGHGVIDFLNDTHALWQWHRNQDSEMVAVDSTYIIRNTTQCPNKMGAQAYRTGMMPGLTMSTATA